MLKHLLNLVVKALLTVITNQEKYMADYTKLDADIAELAAKVDALVAKVSVPPAPVVDEQPAIDQRDAAVVAITAKIPAQ